MGKLIVFEGTDGSGKATQSKLLFERLQREGVDCRKLQFPRYDEKSAALVFYLDVPTELTEKMMREREQATNTKADIHEKDEAYLRSCRENARKVAERCGWQRIDCSRCGQMRFIEDIHEEIYQRVKALL